MILWFGQNIQAADNDIMIWTKYSGSRRWYYDYIQAADDWVPVELELVERMWIPDAEILKLKGFRWQPIDVCAGWGIVSQ